MSMYIARRIVILFLLLLSLSIVACGQQRLGVSVDLSATQSAPTISSLFGEQIIQPTRVATDVSSPIPITTPNPTVIAQATITAMDEKHLVVVPIYNDSLSSEWSIDNSFQSDIDIKNRAYVGNGKYSIKVKPMYTTGTLYFTLNKTVKTVFLRSRVQAVRFYLSGGPKTIDNDAIGVAVVGSNVKSYWVSGDISVQFDGRVTDGEPIFSETRLMYLGINKSIPPKTYVEVTVWLDSLLYDPPYKYLTGFYLKTDKQSVPTFYVDQVSLLLLPD